MATIASTYHKPSGFSATALLAPFHAVGRFMVIVAESSSQARALHQLDRLSDHDLSAKGLTRGGEIRRIFGAAATI